MLSMAGWLPNQIRPNKPEHHSNNIAAFTDC